MKKFLCAGLTLLSCMFAYGQTNEQVAVNPYKDYNRMMFNYTNVEFSVADVTSIGYNGVQFNWVHGFSVMKSAPLYVETGAALGATLRNNGSGSWGSYIWLEVPVNCAYRIDFRNSAMSLSPYLGLVFKGNIIGSDDMASGVFDWYSEYNFKRFQFGWHVGADFRINKFHAGLSYGTDFNRIATKTFSGTFNVGIGFDF